jgi:hypothetical protein
VLCMATACLWKRASRNEGAIFHRVLRPVSVPHFEMSGHAQRQVGQTINLDCDGEIGGALPLAMASRMRGDTKASGARCRMWRSTLFSLRAISSNEFTRPSVRSFIQERARAMAISNTSLAAGSRFRMT